MRPIEWLLALRAERDGLRRLVDAEGLVVAAWRIAQARCRVGAHATEVPTRFDVRSAARELVERLGGSVPSSAVLRADCERLGLPVL
ncbi:MAG: hypothetical protein AAGH15_15645 [Myxococcota bacterium]